jgi:hypothetical protein
MAKIENKHTWGVKTAVRLRAVHASFPDLNPEDRSGYLMDEIEYALEDASSMPGETRASLLETLEDYFPVFSDAPAAPPPAPVEARSGDDLTPGEMVDQLCARSAELTQAQMQKLASLVADLGNHNLGANVPKPVTDKLTFPSSQPEIEDFAKSVAQLWLELGAPTGADAPLRLNRLLKMLGILSGGFRDIYRFLWPFWSELAPREIKAQVAASYPNGLESAILSFVTGGEVGGGEFHAEVEKTKRILLSILFGIRKGADEYGKLYERKFSPEAITDTVALEESASDVGRIRELGRKCWDKYTQVTKHQTADAVHDEIVRAVAEAAFTRLKLSSS